MTPVTTAADGLRAAAASMDEIAAHVLSLGRSTEAAEITELARRWRVRASKEDER